jgi:lysozyme
MNIADLRNMLIQHEGWRDKPYLDSEKKLTIGVGHNLDAKPLSSRAIMLILEDDINDAVEDLDRVFSWWRELSEARQNVLADMSFNMGIVQLQEFKKMWAALQARDYETAADEMLDSKWARQVGKRSETLANMMRTG